MLKIYHRFKEIHTMKPVKHILFTIVALSLVSFFAASHVGAHGETNDFYAGQKAGLMQVQKDTNYEQCSLRFGNVDHEAKTASGQHVAQLMADKQSDDFIKGFRVAYERKWKLHLDTNCGE